jgi:hypothetical protein
MMWTGSSTYGERIVSKKIFDGETWGKEMLGKFRLR